MIMYDGICRSFRMLWFQLRQFARNGYFVQLLITTTVGMVALQALAARVPSAWTATGMADVVTGAGVGAGFGWLRAGMLGAWTVCAVSSGMLGYQRYQGTLVHLVRSPLPPAQALMPILGAASVFGLLALPLAAAASWLLRQPVLMGRFAASLLAAVVFWVACLAISALIGMLFVLTPNAMTYEGLLAVPLVLVSGVFGTPTFLPSWVVQLARILPTRSAVELLFQVSSGGVISGALLAQSLVGTGLWFGATVCAARVVSRRATQSGTLEVV